MKISSITSGKIFLYVCLPLAFIFLQLKLNGQEYAIGADLSFLKSAEDRGFQFK